MMGRGRVGRGERHGWRVFGYLHVWRFSSEWDIEALSGLCISRCRFVYYHLYYPSLPLPVLECPSASTV